MPDRTKGLLISFEGMDGSGKSTHLRRLGLWLSQRGLIYQGYAEPGGTELGDQLRETLLDKGKKLDPIAETLLFLTARAQLVGQILKPALEQHKIVLLDRFTDSTIAYQGYGRGIDMDALQKVAKFAAGELEPDLTFLMDLAPEQAMARFGYGIKPTNDRFESLGADYFIRVRQGYLVLAQENPDRIKVLDSSRNIEIVADEIIYFTREKLSQAGYLTV